MILLLAHVNIPSEQVYLHVGVIRSYFDKVALRRRLRVCNSVCAYSPSIPTLFLVANDTRPSCRELKVRLLIMALVPLSADCPTCERGIGGCEGYKPFERGVGGGEEEWRSGTE